MKKRLFLLCMTAFIFLASLLYFFVELSTPPRSIAIEIASERANDFFQEKCGPLEGVSVATEVLFVGENLFDIRSEIASPGLAPSLVQMSVFPSINFRIFSISNVDIVGTNVTCGE